jgi:coenzyme F420 hydrogenase subunit beta
MPHYDELQSKVIGTGMCTTCGACVSACPNNFIHFENQRLRWPITQSECEYCDKCYNACYVIRREFMGEIAKIIFGIRKKEDLGSFKRIVSARSKESSKQGSQDGGIVTSLLIYAHKEKTIDGAINTQRDRWIPTTHVAKTKEEFISASGTKYGIVPVLKELRPAVIDHGLSRVCIVGSPCHIQSLRYLQYSNMLLASMVKLTIGLFCRENYNSQLIAENMRKKGFEMGEVRKFEISDEFNIWVSERKISFPIVEVKNWVPRHCLVCEDFTNELSDISIGKEGSPEGWSTVIVRTERGEEVFSGLERERFIEIKRLENLDRIKEMAERKREQAKYTRKIFNLKEKGLGREEIVSKVAMSGEIWEKLRISEEWWSYRFECFH